MTNSKSQIQTASKVKKIRQQCMRPRKYELSIGEMAGSVTLLFMLLTTLGNGATAHWVMSFNIRFANPQDGVDYWPNRKDLVASMIRYPRGRTSSASRRLCVRSWMTCRSCCRIIPGILLPDGRMWSCRSRIMNSPPSSTAGAGSELLDSATFWLSERLEEVGSKGLGCCFAAHNVSWLKLKR